MDLLIQDTKLDLIQWISGIQDEGVIEQLSDYKKSTESDWWDELSDEEKASIERGIEDADCGRVHSHKDVMKVFAKYV
jgi:hypothetical protein